MLQGGFSEVLKSQDKREFANELVSFTQRLGFETVSATLVLDHMLGEAEFITIDNTPQAYKDSFNNRVKWPTGSGHATLQAPERAHRLGPDYLRRSGPS